MGTWEWASGIIQKSQFLPPPPKEKQESLDTFLSYPGHSLINKKSLLEKTKGLVQYLTSPACRANTFEMPYSYSSNPVPKSKWAAAFAFLLIFQIKHVIESSPSNYHKRFSETEGSIIFNLFLLGFVPTYFFCQ